jgi:MATE family multidrug resistance protein
LTKAFFRSPENRRGLTALVGSRSLAVFHEVSTTSAALRELRPTFLLALPITAGHVGQIVLGLTDSVMVGRIGAVPLAASTFANSIFSTVFIVLIGLLSSVSVRSAFEHGAGRPAAAGEVLRHGLAIGGVAGVLGGALLHALAGHLAWFDQPPEVAAAAREYLIIVGWSLVPVLLNLALKNHLEALHRPWMPLRWVLVGVALNVFLNWILIYGHLGAPALGLVGAGWATLISRVIGLVGLAIEYQLSATLAPARPQHWLGRLQRGELRQLFALGWPPAVQLFFEAGLFNLAAVMMGWLGVVPLAAHQVALSCAATTFMFPLGIAQALSVRVGNVRGAGEPWRARAIGFGGIGAGAAIMLAFAGVFVVAGRPIAGFFIEDPAVVELATRLLLLAALFQLFDGTQVTSMGALRGLADVRVPTAITCLGYWLLALPAARYLGFHTPMGPEGIWTGLVVGLVTCAVLLLARFARMTRAPRAA